MDTKQRISETVVEEGFDPEDWSELEALGHRMVTDMVDWLSTLGERAPWQPVPEGVRRELATPVPRRPQGARAAYEDFKRQVLPYPWGNVHPRFWGWVNGSGVPMGVLADLLASAMNPNVGAFEQGATYVERQVLIWLVELLDLPAGTSGVLTSGCSMANLIGLATARDEQAGFDVRREGLAAAPQRLTLYGSTETHTSVRRAVDVLGLGLDSFRSIPVGSDWRVDLPALERAIASDRAAGHRPIAVVGNAGTVNTGAIDDLDALADLCAREELWLHVDGAFGALAWLAPEQRGALAGLQRADSLAFDLHKWLYVPTDVGCVFVRDAAAHERAFRLRAAYLGTMRGGLAAIESTFSDRSVELTRRFRALKVWLSLKEHGADKFARLVAQNLAQARYLGRLVRERRELELASEVTLNVVNFRHAAPGLEPEAQDALNRELLIRLQERGIAVPSHTVLGGRFVLRVAITNHRSRRPDFELLADEVVRLGEELIEEARRIGEGAPWMETENDAKEEAARAD